MRRARLLLVALCAAGTLLVMVLALTRETSLAFTLGVRNAAPIVTLKPGESACQRPISVPGGAGFDRIAVTLGTFRRPGPPLDISVRAENGRVLSRGHLAGGYPDITAQPRHAVSVSRVARGDALAVCLTNRGRDPVAVYGDADAASRTSSAYQGRERLPVDMNLVFERNSRSLATLVARIFDRASLFRPGFVGSWLYVVLMLAVVVLVPALLVRALRDATE